MVLTNAGEDDILFCDSCSYCVNAEISTEKEGEKCTRCGKGTLARAKASEVGNIFDLGKKYSQDFSFVFKDKDGKEQHPIMGCFGIGITRLMGVIAEALSDEKGLVWPKSIAPFQVYLVRVGESESVVSSADALYTSLKKAGVEVFYDDIPLRAGEKFADADLMGMPVRITVSERTLTQGKYEVQDRATGETFSCTEAEVVEKCR
jgi:prolyl-tRNA synthetase